MSTASDPTRYVSLDSPLSSASLRYRLRETAIADGPGPHETRPLGLRFAKVVPTPVPVRVRYSHELQVAVNDDGRPLIEEENSEKQWATKHTTDGDEGPEETTWGWEE